MKTTLSFVALYATAHAQFYNITSKPFQILLTSTDGSINDTVSACHVGAALESLCLSNSNSTSKPNPTPYSTFNFNTSIYTQPSTDPAIGTQGILTWTLPTNSGDIPSSVSLNYDPTTNSVLPILYPGSNIPQILGFDSSDELVIQGYIEFTSDGPKAGTPKPYKRWYACKTYYTGYQYEALVWGLGAAKPENPTCVPVSVKRVFV